MLRIALLDIRSALVEKRAPKQNARPAETSGGRLSSEKEARVPATPTISIQDTLHGCTKAKAKVPVRSTGRAVSGCGGPADD